MLITFGTRFCGKISNVNEQWIETKFFSIMFIPIFPVGSMFVTKTAFRKRQGIDIAMNGKSVLATYSRVILPVLAAFSLYYLFNNLQYRYDSNWISTTISLAFLSLIFIGGSIYFYFFFGRANEEEVTIRSKVGRVSGLYAMPHWIDRVQHMHLLDSALRTYQNRYPDADWKQDLQNDNIEKEKLPALFAIALFNCMYYDTPENDELYAQADKLYQLT